LSEFDKPMIHRFTSKKWVFRALIGSWTILLFGFSVCSAAGLKDVRIGEYEDFTRVVFEFSALVHPVDFNDQTPGRLTIDFADTQPRLIRKIPIDRSDRIDDAQLWQKGTSLSAVLMFPFDHYRFEYFSLTEPNRIAVDIFPATQATGAAPAAKNAPPVQSDKTAVSGSREAVAPTTTLPPEHPRQMEQVAPIRETPLEKAAPPPARNGDTPVASMDENPAPSSQTGIRQVEPYPQATKPVGTSFTSRLQYYLVVGLVVITMIILALLVLMLLSRYRERKDTPPLSTNEVLLHQDEAIASLNARIHEQLKRYDEV
jgi:hypothetical protein